MSEQLVEALEKTLQAWEAMGKADMDDAEDEADRFEHLFYRFIAEFHNWVNELSPRPTHVDQLLNHEVYRDITHRLPAPLLLNFETEAELIIDNLIRIEEDKYD